MREFRRNGPADEAIYAAAMAVHQVPLSAHGTRRYVDACGYKGPLHLDALRGTCSFEKEGMMLAPEVVHFPGEYVYSFAYARERAKLKAYVEGKKIRKFRLSG